MLVQYVDDTEKGPGYGFFCCQADGLRQGPVSITLQRASDRLFLNDNGQWSETQQSIVLAGKERGSTLALPLAPSLVRALGTQDTYRLRLSADGRIESAQFSIDSIRYLAEGALDNALVLKQEEYKATQVAEQEANENDSEQHGSVQNTEAPGKKSFFLPILLFLLLLGLGALAWYFLQTQKPDDPPTPSQTPITATNQQEGQKTPDQQGENASSEKTQEEKTQQEHIDERKEASKEEKQEEIIEEKKEEGKEEKKEEKPVPPQQPVAPENPIKEDQAASPVGGATSAPPLTFVQEVQAFFQGSDRTKNTAVALAGKGSAKDGADEDALFRLYYYLDEQGVTDYLLPYAACFDPAYPPFGSIEKNAPEAWRLYEKAKPRFPEAASRQEALHKWLTEAAERGDRNAASWLRLLPN